MSKESLTRHINDLLHRSSDPARHFDHVSQRQTVRSGCNSQLWPHKTRSSCLLLLDNHHCDPCDLDGCAHSHDRDWVDQFEELCLAENGAHLVDCFWQPLNHQESLHAYSENQGVRILFPGNILTLESGIQFG